MAYLLQQLLSAAAHRGPQSEAVRCSGRSLSYRELEEASNRFARALVDGGVQPSDRVGICLPKCVEMVVAVYGTLKAGAVYVPLDPQAPVRRIATVACDCSISALVSTRAKVQTFLGALEPERSPPRLAILIDEPEEPAGSVGLQCPWIAFAIATSLGDAGAPAIQTVDSDLAYILYTSGSTGSPKGVMLTHRNAITFVEWCAARIGVAPGDRLSNHAPLHFDLSVFDLFLAAYSGASVVLIPEEQAFFGTSLARFIEEERITIWYSVPSALMLLAKALGSGARPLAGLRTVVFAGEVYPTKHLRELRRLLPHVALWNLYGPTETNVCTYYRVDDLPEDDLPIPIGRACENTETFVLKEDGSIANVGEEGELYARGSTVMKGYWGRPEATRAVLVPDPRTPSLGDDVYRTGDLVRLRPDGNYDFLGRRDHQIKSRGFRIELGEIDTVLNTHPSVLEAVTVAIPHDVYGTTLAAFVVPRQGERITEKDAKLHLASQLPRYMVPVTVEIVQKLPRTSTGKVDRRLLMAGCIAGASDG